MPGGGDDMIEGHRGQENQSRGRSSVDRLVVLDDDPTGVQTLAGVRVLLAWDAPRIGSALSGRSAVHLITNTRALRVERVQPLVEDAARAALDGVPDARIVLRGDSTLRGHLLEEYLGVREVISPRCWPVLLLVPALPSAGRVTVDGVHLFERNGVRTPLHETEYARDGIFSYDSARLLEWAEQRSGGLFEATAGLELRSPASAPTAMLSRPRWPRWRLVGFLPCSPPMRRRSPTSRRSPAGIASRLRQASTSSFAAPRPSPGYWGDDSLGTRATPDIPRRGARGVRLLRQPDDEAARATACSHRDRSSRPTSASSPELRPVVRSSGSQARCRPLS